MRHGSLFSGIGGFDLAAEWMGWKNVFHCEKEKFCQQVLNYYWPKAKLHEDIRNTDFTIHRDRIDILTGGFPCQPYSTAGKRLGKEDDRHLWPEMLRAVREISPRWIVGENVRGLLNWNGGVVFNEVQADLEVEGYEVLSFLLPAAGVGAPHPRYRIWFVAYSESAGMHREEGNIREANGRPGTGLLSEHIKSSSGPCRSWVTPDTRSDGYSGENKHRKNRCQEKTIEGTKQREGREIAIGERFRRNSWGTREERVTAYTNGFRREGINGEAKRQFTVNRNTWDQFPTQSPVCSRNDGLPYELDGITFSKWRNESIKGYGNAIVPQVAYEIFKAIELYETI